MKKHAIAWIILLMGISLLGLVGLQAYWVRHAWQLKEEAFDRDVNEAMNRAVAQLETREVESVVKDHLSVKTVSEQQPEEIAQPKEEPKPIAKPKTKKTKPKKEPEAKPKEKEKPKATPEETQQPQPKVKADPAGQPQLRPLPIQRPMAGSRSPRASDSVYQYRFNNATTLHGISGNAAKARSIIIQHDTIFSGGQAVFCLKEDSSTFRLFRSDLPQVNIDSLTAIIGKVRDSTWLMHMPRSEQPLVQVYTKAKQDSVIAKYFKTYRSIEADSLFLKSDRFSAVGGTRWIDEAQPQQRTIIKERTNIKEQPAPKQKATAQSSSQLKQESTPTPTKEKVEKTIRQKEEKVNEVMQKMVVELVTKHALLMQRINFDTLEAIVDGAVKNQGITTPYFFAVSDLKNDSGLATAQNAQGLSLKDPYYQVSLFPNDLVQRPEFLLLQFPDKQQYVLSSLWLMLGLSGGFTLVILATFGFTLYFIFRQKRLAEVKNDFINNMTHEFKTPIATISLAANAINSPKVVSAPHRVSYYTDIIQQENMRMLSQVENVLQMAQMEREELKIAPRLLQLDELVQETVSKLRLQIESRKGRLTLHPQSGPLSVMADPLHLQNVLINLLDNANKYSTGAPDIVLSTRCSGTHAILQVTDQGMGMSADVQRRIFDKFYRVPTGNLHDVKGFGLGLSYVKAIVELHHGQVQVQSSPGKGSTFTVLLPLST